MRFVKPLKGFRFWKTIGMLFFSAAVITGSLSSGNKAYALEEPVLPPTMMVAVAPTPAHDSTNLNTSETKKAKVTKKETKAPVVKQTPQETKAKADESVKPAAKVSNAASKKVEIVKTPDPVEDVPEKLALPIMPTENIQASFNEDDEDDDDDFEVATVKPAEEQKAKVEVVEPVKEIEKPVVKAEDKPISKAEILPSEIKQEAKPVVKAETKPVVKAEAKPVAKAEAKPVTKAEVKPVVKAETKSATKVEAKPVVKAEAKPVEKKAKKPAKKVVVDESVIPQEWDWFSAPLVWKEDANGKMVLVADKSAPKIEFGNSTKVVEPLPAFEESKAVLIAEDLPLITSIAPAEPDYTDVTPIVAEDSQEVVALEEAPAISDEIAEADTVVVQPSVEAAPIEVKAEYKPFAVAAEKMARIRRLREAEAEAKGEAVAKASRSANAIRVSNFISELIDRSEASENKIEEEPKTEIVPMAPPAKKVKAEKKAVKSMEKAQIEAENSKNDTRLAKAEKDENMTFEPYVGIFGSSVSRRIDNAKWRTAWIR